MKTINHVFALLFAGISFTACTHQSIELVKPTTSIQPMVFADSVESVHILPESAMQANQPVCYGLETVDQEPKHTPYQQPHVITPSPPPMPRQTVMPVVKTDTLAQY